MVRNVWGEPRNQFLIRQLLDSESVGGPLTQLMQNPPFTSTSRKEMRERRCLLQWFSTGRGWNRSKGPASKYYVPARGGCVQTKSENPRYLLAPTRRQSHSKMATRPAYLLCVHGEKSGLYKTEFSGTIWYDFRDRWAWKTLGEMHVFVACRSCVKRHRLTMGVGSRGSRDLQLSHSSNKLLK